MSERGFDWITRGYVWLVRLLLDFWIAALALLVCVGSGLAVYSSTPSSLVPSTDQGIALAAAPLPDTSSLARTGRFIQNFSLEIQKIPGLSTTGGFIGYLQSFSGADADELFKAR